uniref:HTH psq-type domain-containing protein n=1 Tax=Romanomermis culicivorax TaxID=13658 RepID=A0A915IUE6_ROMCU
KTRVYNQKISSRNYSKYRQEDLDAAPKLIEQGVSRREVANWYKIPRTTLNNHTKGHHSKKHGGQMTLSDKEEDSLVSSILLLAEWAFPLDGMDIQF